MEVGKRYWVTWTAPSRPGSFEEALGVYVGENTALGWAEFDVFEFDKDGGGKRSIRRDHIEQFMESQG